MILSKCYGPRNYNYIYLLSVIYNLFTAYKIEEYEEERLNLLTIQDEIFISIDGNMSSLDNE